MRHRNPTSVTQHPPVLVQFASNAQKSSMLFSMLPSAVQSRLPRLPSIRRSVSMYGLAHRSRFAPAELSTSSGGSSTGSRTPDGAYTNALVLSDTRTMVTEEEVAGYFVENASSDEESTAGFERRKRKNTMTEVAESKSGIGWKFANQGMATLHFERSATHICQVSVFSVSPLTSLPPYRRTRTLEMQALLARSIFTPSHISSEPYRTTSQPKNR